MTEGVYWLSIIYYFFPLNDVYFNFRYLKVFDFRRLIRGGTQKKELILKTTLLSTCKSSNEVTWH